jgi:hypothetical protein
MRNLKKFLHRWFQGTEPYRPRHCGPVVDEFTLADSGDFDRYQSRPGRHRLAS